jgi:hypothetical protein
MDWTKETPSFWKQFTNSGGLEFSEESTTMDTTEMGDVSIEVKLFSHNGVSGSLLQIQTSVRHQVAGSQKVRELASNIAWDF